MPLFWTLAEGLILVAIRGAYLFLNREKTNQRFFLILCVVAFLFLTFLRFYGENFFGNFFDLHDKNHLLFYKRASWNFFCTTWVVLEGGIMVYVLRIYSLLRSEIEKNTDKPHAMGKGIPMIVMVLSFFTLYGLYEYAILFLKMHHGLNMERIHFISIFYVRVCGVFWIAFEWIVAVVGIKTYFYLKKSGEVMP